MSDPRLHHAGLEEHRQKAGYLDVFSIVLGIISLGIVSPLVTRSSFMFSFFLSIDLLLVTSSFLFLVAMASTLGAMASNLLASGY